MLHVNMQVSLWQIGKIYVSNIYYNVSYLGLHISFVSESNKKKITILQTSKTLDFILSL